MAEAPPATPASSAQPGSHRPFEGAPNVASAKPPARNAPFLIASCFIVIGLLWIGGSDWLVQRAAHAAGVSTDTVNRFETLKACASILLTGVMLFLVVQHYIRLMLKAQSKMQRQLEGIAEQYQRLFERNPCAMLIYDPISLKIWSVNDACLLLYGYSRPELLSMTCLDLVVEEEKQRGATVSAEQRSEARNSGTWQSRRRDRRIIFIEATTHQVEFDGRTAGIAMLVDVTDRLHAERTLTQYRDQLEQRVNDRTAELSLANRKLRGEVDERHRIEEDLRAAKLTAEAASNAKSTFLANTSHEIRTPLTSILGYADLLADPELAAGDRTKYLDVLKQNAQHLLALIDDLLDLSRAEMGKVRLAMSEQSPREIAEQAIQLLHQRAEEKALEFTLHIADDSPETLHTDGVRVRQVLLNLLSNAIKFTQRGTVSLSVRLARSDSIDGIPWVAFDVRDSGIGIETKHLASIFEPFYQVDQGATRRYGGSGLGLAISNQLAIQMGGVLRVTSEPGKGSMFTLELPAKRRAATPMGTGNAMIAPEIAANGLLQGTILLAEDNKNIRLLVEEYLKRAGAQVVSVEDGAQALARVKEALDGGTTIDLVVLDLHMPVLGGAEAKAKMREIGYARPIIGLTADYSQKPLTQWLREGWDAMAAKPIDRQAFIPLLAQMMASP